MRTFLIRGVMITFFAVTGLFGSAATVQFDGMSAHVQTHSAEARMKQEPPCRSWYGNPHDSPPRFTCEFN